MRNIILQKKKKILTPMGAPYLFHPKGVIREYKSPLYFQPFFAIFVGWSSIKIVWWAKEKHKSMFLGKTSRFAN